METTHHKHWGEAPKIPAETNQGPAAAQECRRPPTQRATEKTKAQLVRLQDQDHCLMAQSN